MLVSANIISAIVALTATGSPPSYGKAAFLRRDALKMDEAKYSFRVRAYTPKTIPMARLAEYMTQYAALMGSDAYVHFEGLTTGSTVLHSRVEEEHLPKVEQRLQLVGQADAPADVVRAYNAINDLLRADNAYGSIKRKGAKIIQFPGCKLALPQRIGPIKEAGHLEGEVVRIGGRDRTIHIQLLGFDGETYSLSTTSRDVAKELGKHLFTPVRVTGTGTWVRNEVAQWQLEVFAIQGFEPLADRSVIEAFAELREIEGSEWAQSGDPLAQWRELRRN